MTRALSSAERLSMSEIVPVEQCDREAAAREREQEYGRRGIAPGRLETPTEMRAGHRDWDPLVQQHARARVNNPLQSARPVASEGEAVQEAIDQGLRSFCEAEPDFTMSAGMRRSATDHIIAQPGLYPQSALDAARAQERAEIVAWLRQEAEWHDNHRDGAKAGALSLAAEVIEQGDAIATLQHKEAKPPPAQ